MSDAALTRRGITLDPQQELSVQRSTDPKRRVTATTGPAGSGKTTIITTVYERLTDAGHEVVVCAPTGKAAKRVREATGIPARTMHALLEFTSPTDVDEKTGKPYGDTVPRRTRERPIDCTTVIADEYAMVAMQLHRDIVSALPAGGRLVTFGDIEQLTPIETGTFLADNPTAFRSLLDKFDGITLTTVHRQSEGSGILANAQRVLKGLAPKQTSDFVMGVTERPVDAVRRLLLTTDYTRLDNQIIVPSNKSWIGTLKLNDVVQRDVMPHASEWFALPRHKWDKHPVRIAVGDKVVINKNHYTLPCSDGTMGVFNGEVGIVMQITDEDDIIIDFEDRIVSIPAAVEIQLPFKKIVIYPQRDIALAYVLTTHKCQGSEYKRVCYLMNKSVTMMLNRRNLYTGITRAREHVDLITDMRGLSLALSIKEQRSW